MKRGPLPVRDKGEIDPLLLEIIRTNVRNPVEVEGDLYLAACNEVGGRRLVEMMREFGLESIDPLGTHIIESSRQGMLEEIRALPRGTWRNSMRIDGYERELDLVLALTVTDDGIDLDFEGTSAVSSFGITVPKTYTEAYASFGVRCVIGSSIPNNAGSLGPVEIQAPLGCIVNAPHPCAVTAHRSQLIHPHSLGVSRPILCAGRHSSLASLTKFRR